MTISEAQELIKGNRWLYLKTIPRIWYGDDRFYVYIANMKEVRVFPNKMTLDELKKAINEQIMQLNEKEYEIPYL